MKQIVFILIIVCLFLLVADNVQEGYAGKYILKSKIVPPVCPKCPQCPDLVNRCENKRKCPPCQRCKRCPYTGVRRNHNSDVYNNHFSDSILPIPFGLKRGHSSRNDEKVNYKKMVKPEHKPMPWLNSFSDF